MKQQPESSRFSLSPSFNVGGRWKERAQEGSLKGVHAPSLKNSTGLFSHLRKKTLREHRAPRT